MDLRKLDATVAKEIMGEKLFDATIPAKDELGRFVDRGVFPQTVPYYSSDIAAAWEVLDKLRVNLKMTRHHSNETFTVEISSGEGKSVIATATSVPAAICIAALKGHVDVSEWEK